MPVITHAFVSAVPVDPQATAAGEVTPANWNQNHVFTASVVTSVSGTHATMAATEDIREINVVTAFTINLPTSPIAGKFYTVVDTSGNASSNNITIQPITYVIGSNNGAWTGYYSTASAAWVQIA